MDSQSPFLVVLANFGGRSQKINATGVTSLWDPRPDLEAATLVGETSSVFQEGLRGLFKGFNQEGFKRAAS